MRLAATGHVQVGFFGRESGLPASVFDLPRVDVAGSNPEVPCSRVFCDPSGPVGVCGFGSRIELRPIQGGNCRAFPLRPYPLEDAN